MTRLRLLAALACALLVIVAAVPQRSEAATLTTIRVGRASPESFLFALLDAGVAEHIWERVGLNLDMSAFKSDSQQQQAFVAGQLDFAIGSGPSMGYRAKGVPAIAVAEMYGSPANMCVVVSDNGSVKSVGYRLEDIHQGHVLMSLRRASCRSRYSVIAAIAISQ